MNLRTILTFIFVCVQLFFYSAVCTDNHANFQKNDYIAKNFIIDAEKNGMLVKTSNNGHIICQNNSSKFLNSYKEANCGFLSSIAPSLEFNFLNGQISRYKNNFLTTNCTKLAYLTEIQRRAP